MTVSIAVDAMGGDRAPGEIVRGAALGAEEYSDVNLILVGEQRLIENELRSLESESIAPQIRERVGIRHAGEVIQMGESPALALRKKKDASIRRAVELMSEGEAECVISAGNTGAAVAACTLLLKPLPKVLRPGIAVSFPAGNSVCTVIDVGANIQCKPTHLFQYAIMASVFNHYIFGVENPKVGLLNIGAEVAKGTETLKQAHELLAQSNLNFVGNVEGNDIPTGKYNVIVCDGFVGNVMLKLSEGLSFYILDTIEKVLEAKHPEALKDMRAELDVLRSRNDYSEYGGAPLLGVDGISIICHGSSDRRAMRNAVRVAREFSKFQVNKHIVAELASLNV
jgi:glycerol-3-phosphate acyltransferase PlsX